LGGVEQLHMESVKGIWLAALDDFCNWLVREAP
jgi:hypothetical protein